MRPLPRCRLSAALAVAVLVPVSAQAQVIPGLSPEDKQFLIESVIRLNATTPIKIGRSEPWSNPRTNNSGRSTILRVFRLGGTICHLVRHRIFVNGRPTRNYRLTWCRTPSGEWNLGVDPSRQRRRILEQSADEEVFRPAV